jgi:hypothetical protein
VSGFNDLMVCNRSAGATVDGFEQLRSRYTFAMSCLALAVAIPCSIRVSAAILSRSALMSASHCTDCVCISGCSSASVSGINQHGISVIISI